MNTFTINNSKISFKEFLEKILQESGLSKEEFCKHKIVLQIPDIEIYNLVKNNPRIYFSIPMEIKTNEDLEKSKVMLPILNSSVYYITRKNENFTYILEKRTEEEMSDQNYRQTLDKIDENLVNIDVELNEFYSTTNITQYYYNHHNKSVELILKFPHDSSIQFSKFTLHINGKIVISKVLEKEKAKEKYNDAIASGNAGAISSQENNFIVVNIGNIQPNCFVKLTTEFIQFLKSEDMSYCYSTIKNFPVIDIKENKNIKNEKLKNIKAKINVNAHSKIIRLITKGFTNNKSQKFNDDYTQCIINYSLSEKDRKNKVLKKRKISVKEFSDSDSEEDEEEREDKREEEDNEEENSDIFKILFRTEKMNDYNLITQYDPKKDETSCIMSMIYNRNDINIPKNEKPDLDEKNNYIDLYQKNLINSYPSLFIFLIDQSGSMSGKPINIVKETLLFFLQSLPKNSYYQLIGFGSNFKYISSEEPLEYTVENVQKTIKKVKKLKADLGGTQLFEPLKDIFNNNNFDKLNLCKNLFILTDGEVWDREKSLELIKKNLDSFRIHSFGIGDDFDKAFIKKSGKNGSYCFIRDLDKIKSNVIQILNKTLRNYLFDCKINVKNIETEYSYFTKQRIFYQDEFLNFYFIIKNKINNNINIGIEYYEKNELINKDFIFDKNNIIHETNGDIISKIIIGNILNNTILNPEKNIELSKKYQVLSKYTSLYAEVENKESNKNEMITIEQKEIKKDINNESDSEDDMKSKKRAKKYQKKVDISDSDSEDDKKIKKKSKKCKKKVDSSDSDNEVDMKTKKKSKKCNKKIDSSENDSDSEDDDSSDSDNDNEDNRKSKKKSKKCKKKVDSSDSDNEVDMKSKKKSKKCKKKVDSSESDSDNEDNEKCKKESIKFKKKVDSRENDNDYEDNKKSKKKSKIYKKKVDISESESDSENDKKCKKYKNESSNDDKKEIELKENYDIKEMILSQDIIDGNWSLNSQTQFLIRNYSDIYNKIKKYVEKFNVGEKKENIIITILVIYYLKNNKEICQSEYILIINKGLQYLQDIGIKELLYENIESKIK